MNAKEEARKKEVKKTPLTCPFCDVEMEESLFPYCGACRIEVFHCPVCHAVIERGDTVCPQCGTGIMEH